MTMDEALVALEVKNVNSCGNYPYSGVTTFSQLAVQTDQTPSWTGKVILND